MIARLRNIAFPIVFFGLSIPVVLLAPVSALLGRRALRNHVHFWAWVHRISTRVLGIRTRIEGVIPGTQVLYAAKHQSMFETIELLLVLDGPAMVMKSELAAIPVWGWTAKRYGSIVVEREASSAALRKLIRDAAATRATGRSVLIFPEGTRVDPGEQPPLRSGFAGLYKMLALPVVPIAIRSGHVWPRKGLKRAGVVTFRFRETIPAGLPRPEVEARVHREINVMDVETLPAFDPGGAPTQLR